MALHSESEFDDWLGMLETRSKRRRGTVVGLLVLAIVAAIVTGGWVWVRYHDDWALKSIVDAASPDCQPSIERFSLSYRRGTWPHATRYSEALCGGELALGPSVLQARFPSIAAERQDLLADAPTSATCLTGRIVYTDDFDHLSEFHTLCRNVGGDVVDAVSHLPEVSEASAGPTPTMASVDRAVKIEDDRNTAIQRRALAAYFARH